jgi:hypothetical protein
VSSLKEGLTLSSCGHEGPHNQRSGAIILRVASRSHITRNQTQTRCEDREGVGVTGRRANGNGGGDERVLLMCGVKSHGRFNRELSIKNNSRRWVLRHIRVGATDLTVGTLKTGDGVTELTVNSLRGGGGGWG